MDLRIVTYTNPTSLDEYIGILDYDSTDVLYFKFGKQHQELISRMSRKEKIKRCELLINLITKAFGKKFNIQFPERKVRQFFPLTSSFYGR